MTVATIACTNKVLHLNDHGRARCHAQSHNRSQSSMAVAKCSLLRSSAPKEGMVRKNKLSNNDKSSSLKWKVSSQRTFSQTFRGATQSLSPVRVHRTTGRRHMSQYNTACLKLGVREHKRSFSLGDVCEPIFYLPFTGAYG